MENVAPVDRAPAPTIRRVAIDRPWHWLHLGWNDLLAMPGISLVYGAMLVGISVMLILGFWWIDALYLVLPAAAGFAFIAPLLAVGLYQASAERSAGRVSSLMGTLAAYRRNAGQLALVGFVLMALHLIWVRIATLLYALFFNTATPSWQNFIESIFFSPQSLAFLVVGGVIGLALAIAAFAIGAISIPMLLERDVSAFTAIVTSVAAVRANWKAMALWAVLIGGFVAGGLATLFLGLALILPLIGHASWHAYRDLVA